MTDALDQALAVIDTAQSVVDAAVARLASSGLESNQVVAYDVAHAAAAVQCSRGLLTYGSAGDVATADRRHGRVNPRRLCELRVRR